MTSRFMRNSFIYLLILAAVVLVVVMFFRPATGSREVSITSVIAQAQAEDMTLVSNEALFDGFAVKRLW